MALADTVPPNPAEAGSFVAERIDVTGIVQGVGFRPFVYRLAQEIGLTGLVGNHTSGAFVEATGSREQLDQLVHRLRTEAPPLAQILGVIRQPGARHDAGFEIVDSASIGARRATVPPDTAPCDRCLEELFSVDDRRFRHPFINCTDCGPRFTIITGIPYDRPETTMASFAMCPECAAEYADPADRRFHAQPVCCPGCGPTLSYRSVRNGRLEPADEVEPDPLERAIAQLAAGAIVAIKGLGGFHLACGANDDAAIGALRARKRRADKPFAVMVADVAAARRLAEVSDAEAELLTSPAHPIVLLRARHGTTLSPLVARGNPMVGVMVAYTPVHHLLFDARSTPLVMTSANGSGEPIITDEAASEDTLAALCDGVLTHDRAIHAPCDDSVMRVLPGGTRRVARLLPVRRARGYAPTTLGFPEARRSVLAAGGELKNTFCVAAGPSEGSGAGGGTAWVSAHIGDMENLATLEAFSAGVEDFVGFYGVEPDVVAADRHPGYLSSGWARRHHGDRLVEVQHHHAHVASVMAEHQLDPHEPVLGVAFDGTGFGPDGTVWGGEFLVATADGFERVAHLRPIPMPGGDAAVQNPNRVALAHLAAAGIDWDDRLAAVETLEPGEAALLRRQLDRGFNCVPTSSMGRLFDAVASLLDLRHRISYEAQAAIELEIAAASGAQPPRYQFGLEVVGDDPIVVDPGPVLAAIVTDVRRSAVDVESIALGFHRAVADMVQAVVDRVVERHDVDTIALTGGTFQNALLTDLCLDRLDAAGRRTLTHAIVPPNDGGISLGQAYVAAHCSEPSGGEPT